MDKSLEIIEWPLSRPPFSVQEEAIKRVGQKRGYLWALEQGLGKTDVTLADFWTRFDAGLNKSFIIVCPNSLKLNWLREMRLHQYPFDVEVWPNVKNFEAKSGQGLIINYEATRGKGFAFLDNLIDDKDVYIAFDESTALMTPKSQQHINGVWLADKCSTIRCLAGRPNPNGPHDFWGQLRAIRANIGTFWQFRGAYTSRGGYKGKQVIGIKNESRLVERLAPYVFSAKKADWAKDLPPKMPPQQQHVELGPEQQEAYMSMAKHLYADIEAGRIKVNQRVNSIQKLQQISAGFMIDGMGESHRLVPNLKNPKIQLLKDITENLQTKVLIFGFYQESMKILTECFPDAARLLGNKWMSPEEVEREKQRFNEDDDVKFALIQQSAHKWGHTLLGTEARPCDTSIFFENVYSLLTRSQCEDRNHRWGATAGRIWYHDLIASPIDLHAVERLATKEQLSDGLIYTLKEFVNESQSR